MAKILEEALEENPEMDAVTLIKITKNYCPQDFGFNTDKPCPGNCGVCWWQDAKEEGE